MTRSILFVDDEPGALASLQRTFLIVPIAKDCRAKRASHSCRN